ncbi:helix-turn-helix transcriptional regulator [Streptomyces sp. TLI_171]|uniref:helix-turn-helix transcriptional regulator n=1 Tax=Streptomyces sp. TLI_171 TaxID=1938859 RepID=UPI0015D5301F|nr:helix-turn-helix transcriptional regulator [Streptomyces sp. TLI_171]
MDLGELLRDLRLTAGWTQEELADRSGVSAHSISMLEAGRRRPPPAPAVLGGPAGGRARAAGRPSRAAGRGGHRPPCRRAPHSPGGPRSPGLDRPGRAAARARGGGARAAPTPGRKPPVRRPGGGGRVPRRGRPAGPGRR